MANKRIRELPSYKYIISFLQYFPETGKLLWINVPQRSKIKIGDEAGCLKLSDGYRYAQIGGCCVMVHRIVWFMTYGEWPTKYIDHINRVRDDNRISNLRLANEFQNSWNQKIQKRNTSGYRGVHWRKVDKKWCAVIFANKKAKYLGLFNSKESAATAYNSAAKKYFAEYAP